MPDDTRAVVPRDAYDLEHDSDDQSLDAHDVDEHDPDEAHASDGDEPADADHGDDRERFERLEGADYDRVNEFLRERVAFTAREWAIARLCADFRTGTGVEMTRVGENLPTLVPFMDEPYEPGAVSSTRRSLREKVRKAAATFLYGAYADFLTAEEVDDVVYEATEIAKFLIEVEGATLSVNDELSTEERVREAMQAVHEASLELRYDRCPHCGEELGEDAAVTDPA